jgi:hypothetical protein
VSPTESLTVSGAVEGLVDRAVATALLHHVRLQAGPVHVKGGKPNLLARLDGYNNAARFSPWLVLVDLDRHDECAAAFVRQHLPDPAAGMHLRVAVRQVESWLMADAEELSTFLSVPRSSVPSDPDRCEDAKRDMVMLSGRSRRRLVRDEMLPRPRSGRAVGPAYTSRLIEFVSTRWRPEHAAMRSESLERCVRRLLEVASA